MGYLMDMTMQEAEQSREAAIARRILNVEDSVAVKQATK